MGGPHGGPAPRASPKEPKNHSLRRSPRCGEVIAQKGCRRAALCRRCPPVFGFGSPSRQLDSGARAGVPFSCVICTTCGRDNPGHLTFCQECGQRLAPRVAPPTPPIGLPSAGATSPLAATASEPLEASPPPPAAAPGSGTTRAAAQRPPAPEVHFARREDTPPEQPKAPPTTAPCPLCGSANQSGLRFCVSCGHLLAPSPAPTLRPPQGSPNLAPTVPPAALMETAAAPLAPIPSAPPIAPARVVDLGPSPSLAVAGVQSARRTCPRCHGATDGSAQF